MKKIDLKHIAFHVLVGLYFIWLVVFGTLIVITLNNAINNSNPDFIKLLLLWMSLNFIMGILLFIVLRLFRNSTLLGRIINSSFYCIFAIALISSFFILYRL